MQGLVLAEVGHIVNALPPVDITGGKTTDWFHLKKHAHVTLVVQVGVSAAAFTKIIAQAAEDASGTSPEAIAFNVYKEETAAGDTLGSRTAVTTAGLTPSANDNIMYVIELDAQELPEGKEYVALNLTNGTNSVLASVLAILSGSRYAEESSPTVLT